MLYVYMLNILHNSFYVGGQAHYDILKIKLFVLSKY